MCLLFMGAAVFPVNAAAVQTRVPLLIEGKRTLYQRVISHPGAFRCETPGLYEGPAVPAFTPLYVYSRAMVKGEEWLEVGTVSNGGETYWLKSACSSRWDKALSLVTTLRLSRKPLLFFKTKQDLESFISTDNLAAEYSKLVAAFKKCSSGADSPLLAVESQDSAIPQERFYLMPVFDFSSEYDHHNFRLLKIGSVNPGSGGMERKAQALTQFSAGMAFIVDTTISMGPYIEKNKEVVRDTYNAMEKTPLADRLSLAVVAYRNNTNYNPNIGYIAKVIGGFAPASRRADLEGKLRSLNEAAVSTHSFDEDAFAGVKTAIEQLDWSGHSVKAAVLVTDAGAIRNNDKYSSTGMNEEQIRDLLSRRGIQLVVLHLSTPVGKRHNIAQTARQYQTLAG